jgi:indolepyruvate ferredoxin oxidoreductase alpha subunit
MTLTTQSELENVQLKEYVKDVKKYVMMPQFARGRHAVVEERTKKLCEFAESDSINSIELNNTKTAVITSGISYQYAKEALDESVSYLKLGLVYPLPTKKLRDFAEKFDKIFVIEELDGFIEEHCKAIGISVIGKELFGNIGELSQRIVAEKILGKALECTEYTQELPVRPPVMCAGCSHRGVFYVLSKLGLTVSGDIGCYTLSAAPPLSAMDTVICMGASITAMHGFNKVRPEHGKTVAVIGDSTFMHSGITGLVNVAYNESNTLTIILDNSITGMTGHQHNPTTGQNLKGSPAPKIDLEMLCRACGIERVTVVDSYDIEAVEMAVKTELGAKKPSVIIARRPCALLKNVKHEKPLTVDTEKCTGCKMCLKVGCPAVSIADKKASINQNSCTGCKICAKLCKFRAIS